VSVLAATGPSPLWYVARGSGLAALVVLTLATVLGIVTSVRWSNPRWPRFVIELLHRNSSLLAFALIVVHVAAVVADAFAPIGFKDTVIPGVALYRPLWLGLGAAASDILIVLLVTSLLRHRMNHRVWRFLHWFAYLAWPLVVVHGLGTGSDTKLGLVLILYVVCIAAVIVAAWWRLAVGWPEHVGIRVGALTASVVAPIVLVAWLAGGPLAAGWSRRAGTPASILARVTSTPAATTSPPSTAAPTAPPSASGGLPAAPFSAQIAGTQAESNPSAAGRVSIRLATTMSGGATGVLEIDLIGEPLEGGGVLMESSQVSMGPSSQPTLYRGSVVGLRGAQITAAVQSAGRPNLQLVINVQIDASGTTVTGTVAAQLNQGGSGQ